MKHAPYAQTGRLRCVETDEQFLGDTVNFMLRAGKYYLQIR